MDESDSSWEEGTVKQSKTQRAHYIKAQVIMRMVMMKMVTVPCQPALCRLDPVSCSVDRTESRTGSERLYWDH